MNSAHRRSQVAMLAFVSLALFTGCGDSRAGIDDSNGAARPDPLVWFDNLSQRATRHDTAYVRAHTRDDVLYGPRSQNVDAGSTDPAIALCEALMFSKPSNWAASGDSRRIALTATRIAPGMFGGSAWQYSLDLSHEDGDWKIASWPYGQRPVETPAPAPAK